MQVLICIFSNLVLHYVHEYGDAECMSAVHDMRCVSVNGCICAVFGVCAALANR